MAVSSSSSCSSFNPRSPSPGSVSCYKQGMCYGTVVSILAPRHRGACRLKTSGAETNRHVSILAPRHRGACQPIGARIKLIPGVSILAPRHRGACRLIIARSPRKSRFQSSLPVTGERVRAGAPAARRHDGRFNPRSPSPGSVSGSELIERPANRGFNPRSPSPGSVSFREGVTNDLPDVSILAPRHRGACPGFAIPARHRRRRFNPRSPSPGSVSQEKSLLRRQTRRFNPRSPSPGSVSDGDLLAHQGGEGFNPRSPSPGSVSTTSTRAARLTPSFNPRSPSPGSVTTIRRFRWSSARSFNPRSPSPGSVSGQSQSGEQQAPVSILAPRHRGACPCRSASSRSMATFQSSLPVTGERVAGRKRRTRVLPCFNPRSPSPGSVS